MRKLDPDHPLRDPSFRGLLLGRTASSLSDSMMPVALSLAIIKVTGSAEDLALVLLCAVGARLGLLPLAGVLLDRYNVRIAVMLADLARCAVQAFVAAQLLSGHPDIAAIGGSELLAGAASAVSLCGLSPLVAGGVAKEGMRHQANSLIGAGRSTSQLLGPVLAGILVLTVGAGWVFVLDSAAFAIGAVTLVKTRITRITATPRSLRHDLVVGWDEVRRRDWYWSSLIAHASVNFADIVLVTLGPLLASRHHGGQVIWAAVIEAGGTGLLVGSLLSSRCRPERPILAGNLVLALCAVPQVMFALWMPAPILIASYGLSWGAMGFLNPIWSTTVQAAIPPDALARVSSYDWLTSLAAQPVALICAPLAASAWGPAVPLTGTALLVAVACAGTALVPGVRNLRLSGLQAPPGPGHRVLETNGAR